MIQAVATHLLPLHLDEGISLFLAEQHGFRVYEGLSQAVANRQVEFWTSPGIYHHLGMRMDYSVPLPEDAEGQLASQGYLVLGLGGGDRFFFDHHRKDGGSEEFTTLDRLFQVLGSQMPLEDRRLWEVLCQLVRQCDLAGTGELNGLQKAFINFQHFLGVGPALSWLFDFLGKRISRAKRGLPVSWKPGWSKPRVLAEAEKQRQEQAALADYDQSGYFQQNAGPLVFFGASDYPYFRGLAKNQLEAGGILKPDTAAAFTIKRTDGRTHISFSNVSPEAISRVVAAVRQAEASVQGINISGFNLAQPGVLAGTLEEWHFNPKGPNLQSRDWLSWLTLEQVANAVHAAL